MATCKWLCSKIRVAFALNEVFLTFLWTNWSLIFSSFEVVVFIYLIWLLEFNFKLYGIEICLRKKRCWM